MDVLDILWKWRAFWGKHTSGGFCFLSANIWGVGQKITRLHRGICPTSFQENTTHPQAYYPPVLGMREWLRAVRWWLWKWTLWIKNWGESGLLKLFLVSRGLDANSAWFFSFFVRFARSCARTPARFAAKGIAPKILPPHHQQVDSPFAIWWSCHLKTCQTQCGDNTKFLIPLLCVCFTNLIGLVVLLNSLQKQDRNLFGKSLGDRSIIFIDIVPWHLPSITAWILAIYLGSWTCFQTQCIYDRQGVCRQIWWQILWFAVLVEKCV